MPIPKIIHQTYKDYDLPDIYKHCQRVIKKLHPEFEYRFYTDNDMDNLMKTHFPTYYKKFNALPRMIMKIDMFRYFLMYKYGGLYADMDYLMLNPFDLLDEKVVIPSNRIDENGIPTCLGNCIFASEPNHPFWKSLMDTLFSIDRTKIEYNIDDTISNHTLGTGPMFVFDMWKKYSKINNDISVSKGKWFHPPTTNKQQQIGYLKKNGYYGMHICTGIWRNNMLGIKEFNDTFFGTCLIIIFKTLHRLKSGFFHSLRFIKDIITKFTSSYSHLFCYFANNINITFHC